ncbi:hypothetical protein EBN03_01940 [Nocardia stercoris]|uniref:Bacterial bifunctional deaminase-reductase C-terminal domain-containing protein n=1 Tax=Nocardia stercoris TaxID=2483361 RepID=A0A3M2LDZ0_9NOCA|nr:hypothetical protein EBN03_01940 [Nocardia stercoris]
MALEHVTLDGYVSSRRNLGFEWTWRAYSEELAAYGDEHIRADVDTAVYGRETYLGMYEFWGGRPNAESNEHERAHADWVNAVDKIVCSNTLTTADWNNTRVIGGDLAAEFGRLKAQPGGTMSVYASPTLVHSLIELGLIDEFRLIVHPVVIGSGTSLFPDKSELTLDLLESKAFASGAVYTRYRIAQEG